MGKSGESSLELLSKFKAFCYCYDDNKEKLKTFENLHDCNLVFDLDEEIIKIMDFVILSPGISIFSEVVKLAKLYGVEVISELELGTCLTKGRIIGITGTNGKTTTCSLIHHILKKSNKPSVLCGNVGDPITQNIMPYKCNYVVEMSSFQLESLNHLKPDIAVITNITPNHLDRHLTFENYIEAKCNILKNISKHSNIILNYDDNVLRKLDLRHVECNITWVSIKEEIEGYFVKNSKVYFKQNNKTKYICNISDVKLVGEHNVLNVLIAVAVCKALKIKNSKIEEAVNSFLPLKHRLQFVKNVNGIDFVNDSKSTSPDSTITAIKSYSKKPTILILGGSDKDTNFDYLANKIVQSKSIKKVVICGQTAKKIISSLKKYKFENFVDIKDFEDAIYYCYKNACYGDTVLLSPACASFDKFTCFEERGERFIEVVKNL